MTEITREEFLEQLHNALTHLYNADQLRRSPLAELFGVANRFDTSAATRKILVDAIESFRPPAGEPDQSKAWRTYDSLYCCFIQQLNQQVVADQLCISPRQLRREQRNALEHLADRLWAEYQLNNPQAAAGSSAETPPGGQVSEGGETILSGELGWLMESHPAQPNRLADEVRSALAIVEPLVQKEGVLVSSAVGEQLPELAFHPAALNQILVSLLSVAIHAARGGSGSGAVRISARAVSAAVETSIQVEPGPGQAQPQPEDRTNLQIAAELARLGGGRLVMNDRAEGVNRPAGERDAAGSPDAGPIFPIRLILPALEQFPVLVVDDNEDSLQLYKRYAAGTRYQLICKSDTDQVIPLVESLQPRIIVLDIMMPKENGWIVLGRLRQHPLTRQTPIIICTILPQEQLALSLGASTFLKKPVSRETFLQALDQQFALLEPEYP